MDFRPSGSHFSVQLGLAHLSLLYQSADKEERLTRSESAD